MHARPGDQLEEVEDVLALAEAVPEHRDRAQLERGRAEPDQVRVDPVQLESSVRIHVAFGGTSIASSFSIASTKTSSLFWNER